MAALVKLVFDVTSAGDAIRCPSPTPRARPQG